MKNAAERYLPETAEMAHRMRLLIRKHPHALLFASVHGSKLHGFDTPDSDRDIRGCHVLPLEIVIGLAGGPESIRRKDNQGTPGVELATHDVKKFFAMLLNRNGNLLEEVFSPLELVTGPFHVELRDIARDCITRGHYRHFLGMAGQALNAIEKTGRAQAKYALHVYRALLAGIHLMNTGQIEPHLPTLNADARLTHVEELVERRNAALDEARLQPKEVELISDEFNRLKAVLEGASDSSSLPEYPQGRARLNDLLIRVRRTEQFSDSDRVVAMG